MAANPQVRDFLTSRSERVTPEAAELHAYVACTAAAESASADALRMLASWAATQEHERSAT